MFFFPMAPSQAKSERRARWTACKDAAGRQTRRATSDRDAHYPQMFGAKRVSAFATDQFSYDNHTADRKSTI
jgi:hypothetical protein